MPVDVRTIAIPNGETIGYRERAGGEIPLVLLHGNLSSSKHLDLVFEYLDDRYRLYAVDMRGFGESSYITPIDGLEDFATDLEQFAAELGLDSFHLGGWSTGGAVAMVFAAENPTMVRELLLVDSVSTRGYPIYELDENGEPTDRLLTTKEEIAETPRVQMFESGDRERLKEAMWETMVYTHNTPEQDRYEEYIEDSFTQRNLLDVYHALVHFNISDEATERAEGSGIASDIEAPTAVLHGDRDLIIPPETGRQIVADIGDNAEFIALEDSGHSPFVDDLEQLLEKMTTFIEA